MITNSVVPMPKAPAVSAYTASGMREGVEEAGMGAPWGGELHSLRLRPRKKNRCYAESLSIFH